MTRVAVAPTLCQTRPCLLAPLPLCVLLSVLPAGVIFFSFTYVRICFRCGTFFVAFPPVFYVESFSTL